MKTDLRLSLEKGREDIRLSDYPKYRDNPFLEQTLYEIGDRKNKVQGFATIADGKVVSKDGEIIQEGELILGVRKSVDSKAFTKFFHTELKMILGLSERSIKLFIVISSMLEKGELSIDLDFDFVADRMNYSKSSIFRAIGELIRSNLLARTNFQWKFHINPTYLFNGDRMTIVRRYVKDTAWKRDGRGKLKNNNDQIMLSNGEDRGDLE